MAESFVNFSASFVFLHVSFVVSLRHDWCVMLCMFGVHNVVTWHKHVQHYGHNKVSEQNQPLT